MGQNQNSEHQDAPESEQCDNSSLGANGSNAITNREKNQLELWDRETEKRLRAGDRWARQNLSQPEYKKFQAETILLELEHLKLPLFDAGHLVDSFPLHALAERELKKEEELAAPKIEPKPYKLFKSWDS